MIASSAISLSPSVASAMTMPERAFTSFRFDIVFRNEPSTGAGHVAGGDDHHWQIFVDQRIRAVLHLARG